MWIAALTGWYSIVRKGGNGQQWQIRGRVRQDLLNLIAAAKLDGQKVIETFDSDYRYRIVVDKEQLGRVFEALESSIDYPNYKSAMGKIRGQEKHLQAYHKIWAIMAGLQDRARQSAFGSPGSLWERVEDDMGTPDEPPALPSFAKSQTRGGKDKRKKLHPNN